MEGYRYSRAATQLGATLTWSQIARDFSGVDGTTPIGMDNLGRPEYENEIYDPETSRPDPANPGLFLRDPFRNNIVPSNRLDDASQTFAATFYPNSIDPGSASAAYNLARAYFALGKVEHANALSNQQVSSGTGAVSELSEQKLKSALGLKTNE